jgi:hypothetical protein
MAAQSSLTIIKKFPYRGADEEYSNTYHFGDGTPADSAAWKTFADAVIAAEKAALLDYTTIIRAVGHKAGVTVADWEYDYEAHSASVAGTFAHGSNPIEPGDVAAWIRWPTSAKSMKGKPIFLRSYFHNVLPNGTTSPAWDTLHTGMKTALETYGNAWVSGFSDGTNTYVRRGPNGATGGTALASTYLTTRTLERRGRRRSPA